MCFNIPKEEILVPNRQRVKDAALVKSQNKFYEIYI
jgi:hypothetical protein